MQRPGACASRSSRRRAPRPFAKDLRARDRREDPARGDRAEHAPARGPSSRSRCSRRSPRSAALALAAIGAAQRLELRRHAPRAWRWIAWTALAWTIALPLSFAPGPLVDEATPLAAQIALWGAGGLLMAYAMALVTWRGVRKLATSR